MVQEPPASVRPPPIVAISLIHPDVNWDFVDARIRACIEQMDTALKQTTSGTPNYEKLMDCMIVHVPDPPLIKRQATFAFAEAFDMYGKGWANDIAHIMSISRTKLTQTQTNTLLAIGQVFHGCFQDMEARDVPKEQRDKIVESLMGGWLHILFQVQKDSSSREKLLEHPDRLFEHISKYGPGLFKQVTAVQ